MRRVVAGREWARVAPVVIVVSVAYALFVAWRLSLLGGDPSMFIVAGPPSADPSGTLPNVHVFPPGTSYDGQFFYRLALDPWTHVRTAYGITLDEPAYRQQRILYPLVAWAISGGMWQLTPVALIVANLLAVAVLAGTASSYAITLGRSPFAALMGLFYPGYLVTISRNLAELTEAALLVLGLLLIARRRYVLASVALIGGALARETLLVVPIAGFIIWLIRAARKQDRRDPPVLVWLAPLFAYAIWYVLMAVRWADTSVSHGAFLNFGPPLQGVVDHLVSIDLRTTRIWNTDLVELALIAAALAWLIGSYRTRIFINISGVLLVACVLGAIAAIFYSDFVWQDNRAFLRALHGVFLTASLALLSSSVWAPRVLGAVTIPVWILYAVQHAGAP